MNVGPYWYGAGATIQVLLFAMLSAKLKLNAPSAHTWLEIVSARWGKTAHIVFMFFGLSTNVIVSAMLCLGGSATVTDLTGTCIYFSLSVVFCARRANNVRVRHEHDCSVLFDSCWSLYLRYGRWNACHAFMRLVRSILVVHPAHTLCLPLFVS